MKKMGSGGRFLRGPLLSRNLFQIPLRLQPCHDGGEEKDEG